MLDNIQDWYRGQRQAIDFVVTNGVDLTGKDFKLVVSKFRKPKESDQPEFEISGTLVDSNVVRFIPTADDVDRVGNFYYQIKATDQNGFSYPTIVATFQILESVAK